MRKIVLALAATAACIGLLLGAKARSSGRPRSALAGATPAKATAAATGTRPSTAAKDTARNTTATKSGSPRSGRFTGAPEGTPYGTVQVQAVLSGGRLTDVVVLRRTTGGRSDAIDSYALPVLKREALKAQGAQVDVVSGATYTSTGYARSLQAALDKAGR